MNTNGKNGKRKSNVSGLIPYQFKPGQSGNPLGRPKRTVSISDSYARLLGTDLPKACINGGDAINIAITDMIRRGAKLVDFLALATIVRAMSGDVAATKEITDRMQGRAPQALRHIVEDGRTQRINLSALDATDVKSLIALYHKAGAGKELESEKGEADA